METAQPTPSPSPDNSPSDPLKRGFADMLRFWETRRIVYNLLLTAVVIIWIAATWPHFRSAFQLAALLPLLALAFLANVLYCSAYFVDIVLQSSALSAMWRHRRWGLWVLGTLIALVLENYWIADEIYSSCS